MEGVDFFIGLGLGNVWTVPSTGAVPSVVYTGTGTIIIHAC